MNQEITETSSQESSLSSKQNGFPSTSQSSPTLSTTNQQPPLKKSFQNQFKSKRSLLLLITITLIISLFVLTNLGLSKLCPHKAASLFPQLCGKLYGPQTVIYTPLTPPPTPSPSDSPSVTNNWKTYTNLDIGFSFKYPSVFTPSECKQGLHLFLTLSGQKSSEYCETPPYGEISLEYSTSPLSPGYEQSADFKVKADYLTVDSLTANRKTVQKIKDAPGSDYLVYVVFQKRDYYYNFTLNKKNYEQTFNQILSTFQFLPDTSDWKTYKNTEYGFEIKYPDDYFIKELEQAGITIAHNKWKENLVHHPSIAIQIVKTPLSIDAWVEQQITELKNTGYGTYDKNCIMHCVSSRAEETTIGDNIRALQYKTWGVSGGNEYSIIKKDISSDWLIEIANHAAGSREPGETSVPQDVVTQILSTFKFLD